MTKRFGISVCCLAVSLCAVQAQPAGSSTPAEIAIRKAQADIAKSPKYYAGYNSLAMAYARRVRETADPAYYAKAEDVLGKSFALEPDNFEGMKVQAFILLGKHEYARSLEIAKKLNKKTPDDVAVYGYIADADAALGDYKDAVDAAQWMLNIRPGNTPALTRAGYLREVYGDLDGALEVLRMALDATPFQESEERAWLLTRMAHVKLMSNDVKTAETFANNALGVFPNYAYANEALAEVRMAQRRYPEAAAMFQQLYASAGHLEDLFDAGKALCLGGKKDEAAKAFGDFEALALKQSASADNANRQLIEYYADYAKQPQKAVKLAELEASRRHDVYTLDGYAWALAATGEYASAQTQMQKALATGVKDPRILEHAGVIMQHVEGPAGQ